MPTTYLSSLAQPVQGIFLFIPRATQSEEIVPDEDTVFKKAMGRLRVDYRSLPYFPSTLNLASLKERHEPRRDSLMLSAAIR